jgi:antitoxin YefM
MTYSESRAHYAETLNAVVDDREEVVITRAGHEPVVIVALADYESLKETAYLLRRPGERPATGSIDRLSTAAASSGTRWSETFWDESARGGLRPGGRPRTARSSSASTS